jgi:hypothetical protein
VALLGALILLALAALGGYAIAAPRGPAVATPTITSGPSGATSATSATFAFLAGARGDTLECALDNSSFAACTSPKTYSGLRDGTHAFRVRERNSAGQVGDAASRSWTVDTQAPPAPQLQQKPPNPSSSSSATFAFSDRESGVGFECSLDDASYAACTSPKSYSDLADGPHRFGVRALDRAGNRSAATTYQWSVTLATSGLPFTISGGSGGLLAPGLSADLVLRVSNPNGEAILVTSLSVTIQAGSTKAGCDGQANLQVTQSNVSSANPLTVPANDTVTLPSGGVSAPQVLMRNLATNQDACKGATFSFSYSGSSHS